MTIISQLEDKINRRARVLDVRPWFSAAFYEIDLHIPAAWLGAENAIQHIKCRVDKLTYRQYTIAQWDAETHTCTLFIDAAHRGKGSAWAAALKKGDEISYIKIEKQPCKCDSDSCLFLGDVSSVGHFLAVQQSLGSSAAIGGAIVMHNKSQCDELKTYYPRLPVCAMPATGNGIAILTGQIADHEKSNNVAWLAGNTRLVTGVRKQLRQYGYQEKQIKAQGFWR